MGLELIDGLDRLRPAIGMVRPKWAMTAGGDGVLCPGECHDDDDVVAVGEGIEEQSNFAAVLGLATIMAVEAGVHVSDPTNPEPFTA